MKQLKLIIFIFFASNSSFLIANPAASDFNKKEYYKAISSEDVSLLDVELEKFSEGSIHSGYKGAMLMKKSNFMKTPIQKLNLFKEGKVLLEAAILEQPDNWEFRFLRITVQENAPSFLKYNKNISEDVELVSSHFSSFSPMVQEVIQDYANQSTYLNLN